MEVLPNNKHDNNNKTLPPHKRRLSLNGSSNLDTPITRYVTRLADETERLTACHIIHQRNTDNLRAIIQAHKTHKTRKWAVLAGHFHISTKKLQEAIASVEEVTASRKRLVKNKTSRRHRV
jgi:hypothetical protein